MDSLTKDIQNIKNQINNLEVKNAAVPTIRKLHEWDWQQDEKKKKENDQWTGR
jgi:hypothetical protein